MGDQLRACDLCAGFDPPPVFVHPDDDPAHCRVICWRCFDHLRRTPHRHPEWCPCSRLPLTLF